MPDPFREAEAAFDKLREKFEAGKISRDEFTDSLKRLRIKDDAGRFWVIGARSGVWYVHDQGCWTEAKPPSQLERKAICIACGFENDLEAERCARCGSRRDEDGPETPGDVRPEAVGAIGEDAAGPAAGAVVVRALDIRSFFWFFAVFGLFAGILAGLLAGVFGLFTGFVERLPSFFVEHRGDLLGAMGFSIVGGGLGFAAGGAAGALLAAAANGVLSLVGGLRFRRT
jgi:hypothetical protein